MRIKIVVKLLKRKDIFVCEENILEDSLEKQDISVEQEYIEISSEKSFFSSRLLCMRIKLSKKLLFGEAEDP